MGHDRRADPSEQRDRHPERDPDPREHHDQPDVADPTYGVDVGDTEQHPLHDTTATIGHPAGSPRITTPRNTISSTIGAATTAVITIDTT